MARSRRGCLGHDAEGFHLLRGGGYIRVHKFNGGGIGIHKGGNLIRMALRILPADDHAAHREHHVLLAGSAGGILKQLRDIQRSAKLIILHLCAGHMRFRQNAGFHLACQQAGWPVRCVQPHTQP